jgi:hypothetical protein
VLYGGELSDLAQVKNSRSAKNWFSLAEESKTNQIGWLESQPKGVVIGVLQLRIHYNSCNSNGNLSPSRLLRRTDNLCKMTSTQACVGKY